MEINIHTNCYNSNLFKAGKDTSLKTDDEHSLQNQFVPAPI